MQYTMEKNSMGDITLKRVSDGGSVYLQGDDALHFAEKLGGLDCEVKLAQRIDELADYYFTGLKAYSLSVDVENGTTEMEVSAHNEKDAFAMVVADFENDALTFFPLEPQSWGELQAISNMETGRERIYDKHLKMQHAAPALLEACKTALRDLTNTVNYDEGDAQTLATVAELEAAIKSTELEKD